MSRMRRAAPALAIGAMVMALAACSPAADRTPDPARSSAAAEPPADSAADGPDTATPDTATPNIATPPATTPGTATPEGGGLAAGFSIPECGELLPQEELVAAFGDRVELFDDGTPIEFVGPAADSAFASALRSQPCWWGYPNSDGVGRAVIAELAPREGDDLIAALRSSGSFAEAAPFEGVAVFSLWEENAVSGGGVAYAFDGVAWVTVTGTLVDEPLAIDTAARIVRRLG